MFVVYWCCGLVLADVVCKSLFFGVDGVVRCGCFAVVGVCCRCSFLVFVDVAPVCCRYRWRRCLWLFVIVGVVDVCCWCCSLLLALLVFAGAADVV